MNGKFMQVYIDEMSNYCTQRPATYEPFTPCGKQMAVVKPPYGIACILFLSFISFAFILISCVVIASDWTDTEDGDG